MFGYQEIARDGRFRTAFVTRSTIEVWVLLGTGWMPQSGRGHPRPRTILCTCARACSASRSNFCVYTYNGHGIFFVWSVATKLRACVKSTIPACCSFCRTVAERLRQQWHDLASSHVVPRALGRGSSLTELVEDWFASS